MKYLILLFTLAVSLALPAAAKLADRPNIVVIFCDDLGYADVGCFGAKGWKTPTYNTNDWLKTDAYDNNGNTLWSTNGTATGPYFYDAENHLTNFNNTIFITYNGDGQRVKKVTPTTTTLYLVDAMNPSGYAQVLEEQTAGIATNYYTFGLDLISQRNPVMTTNFFGYDGHGSTRFLLNLAGGISDTYMYDAYGSLVTSTGTTANKYLYCGEQWDADLGFYNLRARYLKPNTGRFVTMDSYEGDNDDPLSLHKYLFCHGNPVNNTDPSGHMTADELKDKLREGGQAALEAVQEALEVIATGGGHAEALSGALKSVGPGIVASFLHGNFYDATLVTGKRLMVTKLYPLARQGALHARGEIMKALIAKNSLAIDWGLDQSDKQRGIAPVEMALEESGVYKFVPFFIRWKDLGNQKASVTLFGITWDAALKKFGPDYSKPFGFENPPIGLGIWFYTRSTGLQYSLILNSPFGL